ncbi:MAG: helix-turn-helix transcriptional regulator [Cyclobacteriaceae bacterium]|nr:helix-turn-helix transcriptional regulator [Cyclobacteriaceae bacterium]
METTKTGNRHKGRQVKRFREAIGMKQEVLAKELGITQQNISYYEKQEELDEELFAKLASGMGVSPDVLKDFSSEPSIFSIQEMRDSSQAIYNFNPIEKLMEQAAKIEELYKDLLKSERDKIEVLANANKAVLDLAEEVKKLKRS